MKATIKILSSVAVIALCFTALGEDKRPGIDAKDEKFIKKSADATMTEVELAGLGVQKATRHEVKDLAQKLADDHSSAKDTLQTLATSKSVQISAVIEPTGAAKFKEFEKLSGKAFDDAFLSYMASSHRKAIVAFEEAAKDAKDGDLKAFVDKRLPILRDHLDKIVKLQPPPDTTPAPIPPIF